MNYQGYQSANDEESQATYSRLSQMVSQNVQKIAHNVNQMQQMVNKLGTNQDSKELRSQLHQIQHNTNQLARDTNNHLKEIAHLPIPGLISEQKQRRMFRERLTNDFSEVLKNFQVIQRTAAQKEKESVIRARANSGLGGQSPFGEDTSSPNSLIDLQSPTSKAQTTLQIEEECNIELLRDREQQIRKIESDILEVNQIFKDLATMIHEQGETIDSIEANVETASIQVDQGTLQLAKARDYQAKARRKTCLLTTILASIALLILFVIWLN